MIELLPEQDRAHIGSQAQRAAATSTDTSRGLGRRIHGSVEDTKLSTNKQHTLMTQECRLSGESVWLRKVHGKCKCKCKCTQKRTFSSAMFALKNQPAAMWKAFPASKNQRKRSLRESVLFIGTQFSNLYTAVNTISCFASRKSAGRCTHRERGMTLTPDGSRRILQKFAHASCNFAHPFIHDPPPHSPIASVTGLP